MNLQRLCLFQLREHWFCAQRHKSTSDIESESCLRAPKGLNPRQEVHLGPGQVVCDGALQLQASDLQRHLQVEHRAVPVHRELS